MISFLSRGGFVVVVLLAMVGILSAVTRFQNTVAFLADPTVLEVREFPPELAEIRQFDDRYYASPYLTLVHVITGVLFMVLGPIQFLASIRNRFLSFHRWSGRVFLLASLVGVVSALAFVPLLPVFGSFSTRVGVVVASILFAVSLVMGYVRIRQRQIAKHREWMIRLFAIGLGISTFRVLLPLMMMPPFGASFPEAWDTVVWLGFTVNLVIAEVWINLTRPKPARHQVPAAKSSAFRETVETSIAPAVSN